jgi:hypothetical protein
VSGLAAQIPQKGAKRARDWSGNVRLGVSQADRKDSGLGRSSQKTRPQGQNTLAIGGRAFRKHHDGAVWILGEHGLEID